MISTMTRAAVVTHKLVLPTVLFLAKVSMEASISTGFSRFSKNLAKLRELTFNKIGNSRDSARIYAENATSIAATDFEKMVSRIAVRSKTAPIT